MMLDSHTQSLPAVEQVRRADASDTLPRCAEPWCFVHVVRTGQLCTAHTMARRPRVLGASR